MAAFTGSMMVFPGLSAALLSPWADPESAAPVLPADLAAPGPGTDWRALMGIAQAAFPGAAPRRLMLPADSGKVGGVLWHLLLTFSGLTLVLLGTLATWSFWFGKSARPLARPVRVEPQAEPAE